MIPRSLLFTPAIYPERFEKSYDVGADGIILDLEDSIGESDKERARSEAITYFTSPPKENFVRALRINSTSTAHGLKDLLALIEKKITPDILILPKTESAGGVQIVDRLLSSYTENVKLMPLIESAKGIKMVNAIASSSSRILALCFGAADFAVEMSIKADWETLLFAREQLIQAAKCADIDVLDTPHFDIADDEGLKKEIEKNVKFGFIGKLAIHPRQIPFINEGFSPDAKEVEKARKIIAAMEASHGGVVQVEGKMVDVPILKLAQKMVTRADNIQKRKR